MASGPTQNYDDATLGVWRPRPVLAAVVRGLVAVVPAALAVGLGAAAVRWFPPERAGLHPWVWLALEVLLATAVLLAAGRALRRLLPLSTLLRLSVWFPDRAPSRLAVARRTHSPAVLSPGAGPGAGRGAGPTVPDGDAAHVLALVAALHAHDRTTFRHSERVQAYSALIGEQLGLSRQEVARLGWAGLLHDVGKLEVPLPVLTKPGRPTDDEWAALAGHPSHGTRIVAPLVAWLGPWADAVGQHHERWDGGGYPEGLAGTGISLGARIVAVADAYDVITSARPYKKPLSATAARAELTRCAGSQFDPEVVRALLAVGLGPLRRVAGPVSALAALPGLRTVPLPDVAGALPVLGSASTSAVVAAGLAVASPVLTVPAVPEPVADVVAAPGGGGDAGPTAPSVTTPLHAPSAAVAPAGPATREPSTGSAGHAESALVAADGTGTGTDAPATGGASTTAGATGDAARDAEPGGPGPDAPGATTTPPSPAPPVSAGPPPPSAPSTPAATSCERARAGAVDATGADLSGCDLTGVTLTGSWRGASLQGATLTRATLTDLDLREARLNGADLRDATIVRTRFTAATLAGANLAGASVTDSRFEDADLLGVMFTGATITGSRFEGARTNPATFAGATVSDSTGVG